MMLPAQNQGYVGLVSAESLGDLGLRHLTFERPDFCDFFGSEQLLESGNETGIDGMLFIQRVIGPFEVCHGTVGFDPVNVIDDWQVIRVRDECQSNKTVDSNCLFRLAFEKLDLKVSDRVDACFEDFPETSLRAMPGHAHSIDASNTSKIADFVGVGELGDRNRSPFFGESGIHTTGCPSGVVGLTIKDPSHVATFGGSAFMASASDNFNRRLRFRFHWQM